MAAASRDGRYGGERLGLLDERRIERMRVLVIGGDRAGRRGADAPRLAASGARAVRLGRPRGARPDRQPGRRRVDAHAGRTPSINAAAYTAVDKAESEPELRLRRQRRRRRRVLAAARRGAPFRVIHLSTDYVFDGAKDGAYVEDDPVSPLGVYGRTKLAGEERPCARANPRHVILRTSWVYGAHGDEFRPDDAARSAASATQLARRRRPARLPDRRRRPRRRAIACSIAQALDRRGATSGHLSRRRARRDTTWHGFAERDLRERAARGWPPAARSSRSRTADYPTAGAPAAELAASTCDKLAARLRPVGCPPSRRPGRTVLDELLGPADMQKGARMKGIILAGGSRHAAASDHAARSTSSCCRSTTSR